MTAGRAWKNCRRSRRPCRSTPRARSSPATSSPDIGFDRSINPYRGCEHGCVYCFARPTHAYLGLSPGLDFESKLFAKPDAPVLLERELAAANYEPRTIAIGTNTDPYQPIEKKYEIMRRILEVLERAGHPVGIVTKSALVTRDIDILSRMAKRNLVRVAISVTTLDAKLARTMEPRAATPARRLEALRQLSEAGIPTTAMVAPIIPAINDMDIERILDAIAQAGVKNAGYVLLRLPLEVRDLFKEWLMANYPDRYRHVMKLIRDMRGGKDYDSTWGKRMTGDGPYAWMIGRRFEAHCEQARAERAAPAAFDRTFPEAEEIHRPVEFVLTSTKTMTPHAHLSLVTLGVSDVVRAAQFYERLGFKRKMAKSEGVAFFEAGPVVLSLYTNDGLTGDAGLAIEPAAGFRATCMAWNCADETSVDAVLDLAREIRRYAGQSRVPDFLGRLCRIFQRSRRASLGSRPQSPVSTIGGRPDHASRLNICVPSLVAVTSRS